MIGKTISHYKILEELGRGGMGVVYKAEDTKLRRTVALKFLSPQALGAEDDKARFLHEAQAAAALNHPNICTVYEIDESEGQSYIAMEYIEGESLDSMIKTGPLKLSEAINIIIQTSGALQEAHDKGIIHRDIKPANIMISEKGQAKVMDFGLAKAPGYTKLTKEGTTLGTVFCMSPEQASGREVDRRTDIWSLGVVLYKMITGRLPFRGDYEQAVMYAIMNEEPEPLTALRTGVPMELERIVLKALAKKSDERYQHADEMISDLRRLKGALTVSGETDRPSRTTAGTKKKLPAWAFIAVAIIALIILWIGFIRPRFSGSDLVAAPKPIAVISFENLTGDSSYDYLSKAIPNLLITNLEQSKYISVITWERMRDLVRRLGREEVEIIDAELGFEICRLDGIEAIVVGSYVKAGNSFATELKVLDVETKKLLETASARGDGVESILDSQIDELSKKISRGVGLSERKIMETQRPVIDVTTTSMEAYHLFLKGRDEFERFYYAEARRSLERAISLDSTFAVAYLYLARVHANLRDYRLRKELYDKAKQYASKATERERLYIEAAYAAFTEGDTERQVMLLKELIQKYPKEKNAYHRLAQIYRYKGMYDEAIAAFNAALELDPLYARAVNNLAYTYMGIEEYEKAIELFEQCIELAPKDANPYDSMGELYYTIGDIDKAIAHYRKAVEVKPDFYHSMAGLSCMYMIKGDFDSTGLWMERYMQIAPTAGARAYGFWWRSALNLGLGRYEQVVVDCNEIMELSKSAEWEFAIANAPLLKATRFYEVGRLDEARDLLIAWFEAASEREPAGVLSNSIVLKFYLGLIALKSGNMEEVRVFEQELEGFIEMVEEKIQRKLRFSRNWFVLLQGELLLAEGRYDEAIDIMEHGFKLTVPDLGGTEMEQHNTPFDQDVIARAHAAKGDLEKAIAEYERLIMYNPGSNDRRARRPKYHYRLAKLYEESGRSSEAIEQYERFLSIWKDADEGLPELVDARMRLSKLRPLNQ